MERLTRTRARTQRQELGTLRSSFWLAAGVAATGALLVTLAAAVPSALVLPIFCLLALAIAGIMAFAASLNGRRRASEQLTAWDIAGGFALIGFAAAILSDPTLVVSLLEGGTATK
jgi:uncharacterized membrane protein YfcA